MPAVLDVLQQARRRLGIQENPPHSNRTAIGVQFGWNGVPWCAEYVCVCLSEAGFKIRKNASAPSLFAQLRNAGWRTPPVSQSRAGDVVFFDWPDTSSTIDHTGIIEGRKADGRLITLEGNTTLDNGNDGVARRVRSTTLVAAIARPPYTNTNYVFHPVKAHKLPPMIHQGSAGPWVRALQMRLGGLAITGNFGERTKDAVLAFQRKHRLQPDGIVGNHTWKALGW